MLSDVLQLKPSIRTFLFITLIVCTENNIHAQTKSEIAHSKEIYEGTWYNKNDKRFISFNYEDDATFVTINDWIQGARDGADAYKAFIKGEKLILYAENDDHHAPYCEIGLENSKLIYRCNEMNCTDNFLHTKEPGDTVIFIRVKK